MAPPGGYSPSPPPTLHWGERLRAGPSWCRRLCTGSLSFELMENYEHYLFWLDPKWGKKKMPNNISARKDCTRFHGGQGWEGRKDKPCVEDPECWLLTWPRAPSVYAASLGAQVNHREKVPEHHQAQGLWKWQRMPPPRPPPCPTVPALTTPKSHPFWHNDRALLPVFLAGFEFFETSAKDNINVKQTFERLVDVICDKMSESLDTEQAATAAKQSARLKETPPPPQPGCGC